MDESSEAWVSPGFGYLTFTGLALGVTTGVAIGMLFAIAFVAVAGVASPSSGEESIGLIFLGMFYGAFLGCVFGLLIGLVGSCLIAPVLAAWLHSRRVEARPLRWVRNRARIVGAVLSALYADIAVLVLSDARDAGVVVLVVPAVLVVTAGAVVAGYLVTIASHARDPDAFWGVRPSS